MVDVELEEDAQGTFLRTARGLLREQGAGDLPLFPLCASEQLLPGGKKTRGLLMGDGVGSFPEGRWCWKRTHKLCKIRDRGGKGTGRTTVKIQRLNLRDGTGKVRLGDAKSLQSCPTLYATMDYTLPYSSVHGILQARILE